MPEQDTTSTKSYWPNRHIIHSSGPFTERLGWKATPHGIVAYEQLEGQYPQQLKLNFVHQGRLYERLIYKTYDPRYISRLCQRFADDILQNT